MRILAIECSSPKHSLALLDEGQIVAEKQWETTPRGGQRVFDRLEELLAETKLSPSDMDLWVCGSGPGNFSGMRVSMAAVKAFALALDTRIEAVSSGEALAFAYMQEQGCAAVSIVGDARRGHLWHGHCRLVESIVEVDGGWKLCDYVDLESALQSGIPCVSSEPERITIALSKAEVAPLKLESLQYPSAGALGRLLFARLEADSPSQPMRPLYMHDAI